MAASDTRRGDAAWREGEMNREKILKVVMVLVGLLFVAGIYPIVTGLRGGSASDYGDLMLLSLYVTLGVFLLLAVRNPAAHRSLIGFTAWSFAHGAVMTVLGFQHPSDRGDFWSGSGVLAVIGVLLLVLLPGKQVEDARAAA